MRTNRSYIEYISSTKEGITALNEIRTNLLNIIANIENFNSIGGNRTERMYLDYILDASRVQMTAIELLMFLRKQEYNTCEEVRAVRELDRSVKLSQNIKEVKNVYHKQFT